jgi:dTDP-4-dehydrorhamnose 3,5-epimerase
MNVIPLSIHGLLLVEMVLHRDARGVFVETYSQRSFRAAGIDCDFVQDNLSRSSRTGTVRGLHYQTPPAEQAKLVRVGRGRILDVAVDIRMGSPTYGRHVAVELSAEEGRALFVPEGFAHGFCTLEPDTEVLYKTSAFYAPECDRGLLWNDPALGIDWRIVPETAVLSDKDTRHPRLADLAPVFTYSG